MVIILTLQYQRPSYRELLRAVSRLQLLIKHEIILTTFSGLTFSSPLMEIFSSQLVFAAHTSISEQRVARVTP